MTRICHVWAWPALKSRASAAVESAMEASARIMTRRRSQRSTSAPATGPRAIRGMSVIRLAVARVVAEPVDSVSYQMRENWTSSLPTSERAWPPQIEKNRAFHADALGCSITSSSHPQIGRHNDVMTAARSQAPVYSRSALGGNCLVRGARAIAGPGTWLGIAALEGRMRELGLRQMRLAGFHIVSRDSASVLGDVWRTRLLWVAIRL